MRRLPWTLACSALVSVWIAGPAAALDPGTWILALEATSGVADLVSESGGYLAAYDHGEIGVQGQAWYLASDAWAVALSGGPARTREANRAAGVPDRYYQQRAWCARIGIDRMLPLADDAILFFGPGVEYWRGHSRFIGYFADPVVDGADVSRWSASGRFGALVVVTDAIGLTGHLGFRMGYASASEGGLESGWYTSGYEAAAGIAFAF